MITQMSRAIYPDKREVENWLTMNTKIKQLQSENGGLRELLHLSKRNGSTKMFFETDSASNSLGEGSSRTSSDEINATSSSDETTVIINSEHDDEPDFNFATEQASSTSNTGGIISNTDEQFEESDDVETCSISTCSTIINGDVDYDGVTDDADLIYNSE